VMLPLETSPVDSGSTDEDQHNNCVRDLRHPSNMLAGWRCRLAHTPSVLSTWWPPAQSWTDAFCGRVSVATQ
jgi:hypothetical protein